MLLVNERFCLQSAFCRGSGAVSREYLTCRDVWYTEDTGLPYFDRAAVKAKGN